MLFGVHGCVASHVESDPPGTGIKKNEVMFYSSWKMMTKNTFLEQNLMKFFVYPRHVCVLPNFLQICHAVVMSMKGAAHDKPKTAHMKLLSKAENRITRSHFYCLETKS